MRERNNSGPGDSGPVYGSNAEDLSLPGTCHFGLELLISSRIVRQSFSSNGKQSCSNPWVCSSRGINPTAQQRVPIFLICENTQVPHFSSSHYEIMFSSLKIALNPDQTSALSLPSSKSIHSPNLLKTEKCIRSENG